MSVTLTKSRVFILIKALPRPSKKHSETVCCAGVTDKGEFKRLYPVRYRQLKEHATFGRWDEVEFSYQLPKSDRRFESCYVAEETIRKTGREMAKRDRPAFMDRLIKPSAKHLAAEGKSLGIIRPENTRFSWRQKTKAEIEAERQAYVNAARQEAMFDERLDAIEPSPYHFRFSFTDADGKHSYACADWEAHATFFLQRLRSSEAEALTFLSGKFNDEYPRKGMLFALGNIAKRPQTWQLLGVLRVDPAAQSGLF